MKSKIILVCLFLAVGLIYGDEQATKTSKAKETSSSDNVICKTCKCLPDDKIIDCSKKSLTKMFTPYDWSALEATNDDYEVLRLNNNKLEGIDTQFPVLKFALKIVDLSHNKISKIIKNAFTNLSYIEELDLSHNELTVASLKPNVFEGRYSPDEYEPIRTLKILRLSHNSLHSLDEDVFEHTSHLQELYLDNNPFQIIHTSVLNAFSDLPQLQKLDLNRCELTELPSDIFHPLKALKWLNLEGNLFTKIPTKALQYAKNVRELSLDDNPIEDLDTTNSLPPMPNLEKLNLTNIGSLKKILKGAFAGLPSLTELHLSNNHHLSVIEEDAFQFQEKDDERTLWPPLKRLYLNNNNLSTLVSDTFMTWDKMEEIHIHDNPWLCDCGLNFILNHLMPIINSTTPHMIEHIKCASPSVYVDRKLLDLKESEFHLRCLAKNGGHPERDSALLIALLIGVLLGMPLTFACVLIYKRFFNDNNKRGAAKYSRAFYKRADMQEDNMHI